SLRGGRRPWARSSGAGTRSHRYVRHIDGDKQYIGRMARANAILSHMAFRAIVRLLLAHPIVGASVAFLVRSGLGAAPWDVFHVGLARATGLSVGTATIVTA